MKRQIESPSFVGVTIASVVLLFVVGCVDLDKPENVKACASSTAGCSDSPKSPDAGRDGARDLPDASTPQDALSADGRDGLVVVDLGNDRGGSPDVIDGLERTDAIPMVMDVGRADGPAQDMQDFDTRLDDLVTPPDLPEPPDLPVTPDLPSSPDLPVTLDLPGLDLLAPLDVSPDQGRLDTEPGNCILQIISNGYKAGTAPACSACNDGNGNSLASKCTGMLDCLSPPRTSADFLFCRNQVAGSSLVGDCVNALTKVGCPKGY